MDRNVWRMILEQIAKYNVLELLIMKHVCKTLWMLARDDMLWFRACRALFTFVQKRYCRDIQGTLGGCCTFGMSKYAYDPRQGVGIL
jgi:hypothetical protein